MTLVVFVDADARGLPGSIEPIAAGADAVMVDSLFAGTEEAPGETVLYQGQDRTWGAFREALREILAETGCAADRTLYMGDDYIDEFNSGCGSSQQPLPFSTITQEVFCGVSGWYLFQGSNYRDTDWFELTVPAAGYIEITGDAERPTFMFELGPQDCDEVGVVH